MTLWAIKEGKQFVYEGNDLVIDEQSEGNNNPGTPLLFSSKRLAENTIENYRMKGEWKPVKLKLVEVK